MKYIIDIESDGLLEEATKIHVASVYNLDDDSLVSYFGRKDITNFFSSLTEDDTIIGHNFIRFDARIIEKLCNIKLKPKIIDTLALSWYLYPNVKIHGLEAWGEILGVKKPEIKDWNSLSKEEYAFRCEQDVVINKLLWNRQFNHLLKLYESEQSANKLINYLMFKMNCARIQEENRWKLDIDLVNSEIIRLEELKLEKTSALKSVMPKVYTYKTVTKPTGLLKKDGKYSARGLQWLNLLKEHYLPDDYEGEIQILHKEEEPNPTSMVQIKQWLFDLGWKPETFAYRKNKETGEEKKIEQICNSDKELCPSIISMIDTVPELNHLNGLFTINNRLGILRGFLRDVSPDGFLQARIAGLTNTLRFKHKELVNLPKVKAPYAENIRACLTVPNDSYILCGSDVSSLEDSTKRHYLYKYDPEYVKSQMTEGFDAHLAIAELAGILTPQQVEEHKQGIKSYSAERQLAKAVNFAGVYGAGPAKIAQTAKISLSLAKKLHSAYWDLNWSVKTFAADCISKEVYGQMWAFNPISKLWYSLRAEKDIFSTINQSSGVYCFDSWLSHIIKYNDKYKMLGQFHDEGIWLLPNNEENINDFKNVLLESMEKVNTNLKLNVKLGISIDFGKNYKEIH